MWQNVYGWIYRYNRLTDRSEKRHSFQVKHHRTEGRECESRIITNVEYTYYLDRHTKQGNGRFTGNWSEHNDRDEWSNIGFSKGWGRLRRRRREQRKVGVFSIYAINTPNTLRDDWLVSEANTKKEMEDRNTGIIEWKRMIIQETKQRKEGNMHY